ncbi:tetratricopeptide repeat protein [Flagellimonas sp. GZD32]|uniref:tetratricopeptide repeat-containing sensor histidine kinase n=1 Tax=Flagellimonas cixiensis TaxID=3228750 RepID=UPI0035C886A0
MSITVAVQAQNDKIESLKNELARHIKKDTTRVNLLNDLALAYFSSNLPNSLEYLGEADTIAESIDFKKGKAQSFYIKGLVAARESNFREGFSNYTKSLKLFERIRWNDGIASCYKQMGIYMFNNGKQDEAISYLKKSLEFFSRSKKKIEIAQVQYELGWSYIEIDNYTEARYYLLKALEINKTINNQEAMASCMNGIAVTYSNQGNYLIALDYYNKTLGIAQKNSITRREMLTFGNIGALYSDLEKYDKAIEYYNKVLELSNDSDKYITSRTFSNIGLAYIGKKENKLALDYLKKSQKIYKKINDQRGEAFAFNNIGDIYLEEKNYPNAEKCFEQAKKISLEIDNQRGLCKSFLGLATVNTYEKNYDKALFNALKSKSLSYEHEFLDYQRQVNELLSIIYSKTGNYKKALESHQQFKILNDSIFNKENIEKIAQLEYEYKYKQALDSASIRELKLTKTVMNTSQDLAKTKQNYLWAVIGILVISILSGSLVFYQKYKNVKVKNQNIMTEQRLLRSQMTPHFLFNSLSVLQGMILNKEEKKSITYLTKFSKLLRIVLENSRDKIVPLIQELDAIDNYMILQNLDTDLPYDYSLIVDENIDINLFLIPPMLIQPFIENVIEHAFIHDQEQREIEIHLSLKNQKLSCTITDNGVGIDSMLQKTNTKKKSLATTITSERLNLLAKDFNMPGSVFVEDRKRYNEQGTKVTLIIPYKLMENS